jgi:aspartate/methionine/tyrosine aminotransferase
VNRGLLMDAFEGFGVTRIAPPDGAFYLYADVGHLTRDSLLWCRDLLDATGVALNTGRDFDSVHGDRFIRISFAVSTAETVQAIEALGDWLDTRKRA